VKTLQNFINGQKVQSSSDKTQDLINPATGEVFAKAPVSNAADVDKAMKAAEKAFEVWKESTPGERQKAINKIADAIEARSEELIRHVQKKLVQCWIRFASSLAQLAILKGVQQRNISKVIPLLFAANQSECAHKSLLGIIR